MIQCAEGSVLVGPDNGILAPLGHALGRPRGFRIDPRRLEGTPRRGTTFDGRDLFAPAAALLARGIRPAHLGTPHAFRDLRLPLAVRRRDGARGEILHRDTFGNLITNIPTDWVDTTSKSVRVAIGRGRRRTLPWTGSYEALGRGNLGALGSSFGTVELAVAEGRADRRCRAGPGTPIRLESGRREGRPRLPDGLRMSRGGSRAGGRADVFGGPLHPGRATLLCKPPRH